jgi:4'-phosphopantetheinyl transferase
VTSAVAVSAGEVWVVDIAAEPVLAAEDVLSADEHDRASKLLAPEHRRRFVAGRSALRVILGAHLDRSPASLRFGRGPHGAPYVVGQAGQLRFSVSYSGALCLVAVACVRVGVDVENVVAAVDYERIAARYFHESEAAAIVASPLEERRRVFFQYWTSKEAYAKALGMGLLKPFQQFEVEISPDGARRLRSDAGRPRPGWSLCALDLGSDYAGTLAIESVRAAPRVRRFDESSSFVLARGLTCAPF